MIKIGEQLPDVKLWETTEFGEACPVSPKPLSLREALGAKKVVIFGLPGAFTGTCSRKHVPGYLQHFEALRAKGVDEVWCVSVNDGYVMAEWGRQQKALGKIRFLGDGNGELAAKLGLELDDREWGMGIRMRRCSMLMEGGVVKRFNVEEPGKFGATSAETMLEQLG